MITKKQLRCDYFNVFYNKYDIESNSIDPTDIPYNLGSLFIKLQNGTLDKTERSIFGETSKIQKINSNDDFWEIQIVRTRTAILPGILNSSGEYNSLELDDDEFIGEDVCLIYHVDSNILSLQRNRFALSPSGIEKYLNMLLGDVRYYIKLNPIANDQRDELLDANDIYRNLSISYSMNNYKECAIGSNNAVLSLIHKACSSFDAKSISINISVGRGASKNSSLNKEQMLTIQQLREMSGFSKIEIGLKENEDTAVEVIDLISSRLMDFMTFNYDRHEQITYDRILIAMRDKFNDRLQSYNLI